YSNSDQIHYDVEVQATRTLTRTFDGNTKFSELGISANGGGNLGVTAQAHWSFGVGLFNATSSTQPLSFYVHLGPADASLAARVDNFEAELKLTTPGGTDALDVTVNGSVDVSATVGATFKSAFLGGDGYASKAELNAAGSNLVGQLQTTASSSLDANLTADL